MNCGLFGVRFSVLWHKKGAIAPVDYLSTFATAPFCTCFRRKMAIIFCKIDKIVLVSKGGVSYDTFQTFQ